MNKIKFNFSEKSAKKILSVFLKYKYLLFFIFFSVSLGFVFIVAHKYAYVDIKFIEYEESSESMVILNIKKSDRALKEILANIEERNKEFETRKDLEYNNPFEFREADALLEDKKSDILNSEVENNLMPSPIVETENDTINNNDD